MLAEEKRVDVLALKNLLVQMPWNQHKIFDTDLIFDIARSAKNFLAIVVLITWSYVYHVDKFLAIADD